MRAWLRLHLVDAVLIAIGIGIAVLLRVSLLDFKSADYFDYTKIWYNTLRAEGFHAFARGFSNYNLPYLYLLYAVIRFFPELSPVVAVKIPSLVADFVAAWFMVRIVSLKYRASAIPLLAGFVSLFAPTVVLNSAFWGQADAVYACVALAAIYFVARRQDTMAMILFGLALALKAQAIFLLPLMGALVLRHEIRWRAVLWVPLAYVVALVPALLAGRPLLDLLLIYPSQVSQYEQLSMHAPSLLAWIPDTGRYYPFFYAFGLILAAAASIAFAWAVVRSTSKFDPDLVVELALISVTLLPFLLPKMHERYFYLADVLAIAFAFYVPSYYFVPLLLITASFFAYQPTLFGVQPVSMGILALVVFVVLVALLRHALPRLSPAETHSSLPRREVELEP